MKLENYKLLAITLGAGVAGAVVVSAIGAQKSYVLAAALAGGSGSAIVLNNKENAESEDFIAKEMKKYDAAMESTTTLNDYFNSAHDKYLSGNYEDALADCITALSFNGKHVKSMRLKAYLYLSLRQQNDARESFLDLVNNNKDLLARDFLDLGSVEVALSQYKSASKHLSKAIERNIEQITSSSPSELNALDTYEFSRAAYKLILSYYELGDYQLGLEILTKWEQVNEQNTSVQILYNKHCAPHYVLIAEIYDAMINPVKAIEAISTAIDLDPDSQYYRFNRGVLKRKSADHQGDIEDFTKAFEIDPSFAEAVYEIGSIYFDIGDSEKACKNWKIGSELEHANSQILLNKHCNQSFNDYNKITE